MDSPGHSLLAYCIRKQYEIVHKDVMSLLYIKGNSSCIMSSTRRRAENIGQFFAGQVIVYGRPPDWDYKCRSPEQDIPDALNWSPFRGPIFTSCCSACKWGPRSYTDPEERDAKVAYPLCRTCMTINRAPTIFTILARKGVCTDVVRIILRYFLQPVIAYLETDTWRWPSEHKDWETIGASETKEIMIHYHDRIVKPPEEMDPVKKELMTFCLNRPHSILIQGADSFLKFKGAVSYMLMSTTSRADSLDRFFAGDIKVIGRLPDWPGRQFLPIERLLTALNNKRVRFTMHCDACGAVLVKTPLCADCSAAWRIPLVLAVMKKILCDDVVRGIVGFFLRVMEKNNGSCALS